MTVSKDYAQAVDAHMVDVIVGQIVGATVGAVPVSVYPTNQTSLAALAVVASNYQHRAHAVQVVAASNSFGVWVSLNGPVLTPSGDNQVDPLAGFLVRGEPAQILNLPPQQNTVWLRQAVPNTVQVNWFMGPAA